MALFSKRRSVAGSGDADPRLWIGRKFRSECSIEASLANFYRARDECYQVTEELAATWTVPSTAASFISTQGRPSAVPPAKVYSWRTAHDGVITLALWDGMVSWSDDLGVGGPPIEMWFVPSGFHQQPIPIAGRWKMQDLSLSSIGWGESPLWGAS